jgi:DUF1680 family protein
MALEELPEAAASLDADGELAIHVHGPLEVAFDVAPGRPVRLRQATGYPYDVTLTLQLDADEALQLARRLRVPDWAERATLSVAGAPAAPVDAQAGYVHVERDWEPGDVVVLQLPMPPRLLHGALRNIQESRAPDGSPVAQQVLFHPYVALARGPLVYATGLLDGYKSTESLLLPQPPESAVSELGPAAGSDVPRLRLAPLRRAPIDFLPAFLADGRRDGGWRLTWMALAPDDLPDRA